MAESVKFVSIEDGKIVRNHIDQVGNNLTARLYWCVTHLEPVWCYGDGSFECPHDRITEVSSDNHVITDLWKVVGDDTPS